MTPTAKKPLAGTKAATPAKPDAVAKKPGATPLKRGIKLSSAKLEPGGSSLPLEPSKADGMASTVVEEDQAAALSTTKLQDSKLQIDEAIDRQTGAHVVKKINGEENRKLDFSGTKMTSPPLKKKKKAVSFSATPAKTVQESKKEQKDIANGKELVSLQQTKDTNVSKKKGSLCEASEKEVEASEGDAELEGTAEQDYQQDEREEEEDEGDVGENEESKVELEEGNEEGNEDFPEEGDLKETALEGTHDIAQSHETKSGSEKQKRKKLEVFVGGLDGNASEADVKKALEHAGEIVDVRVMRDLQTGKSKGYAFVRFATTEQCAHAVTDIGKIQIRGRLCEIGASAINDVLYVGNINKYWKKEQVENKLKELGVGGIEELTVMEDPHNPGINRGYAFMELASHTDANRAFRRLQMPDAIFGFNRSAKVAWAEPEEEPDETIMAQVKSVFVDGLPALWTEEKVKQHFGKFGEIERIVLARNMPTARRKDFGFINFSTRESTLACIDAFKEADLVDGENRFKVRITLAKPAPKVKPKAVKGFIQGDHPIGGPVVWRNEGMGQSLPEFKRPARGGRNFGPVQDHHHMPGNFARQRYEYTAPQEEMWAGEYEDEMYQYEIPRDRQIPGSQRMSRVSPRDPYFRMEQQHHGHGGFIPGTEFRQDDCGNDYPPAAVAPPRCYGTWPPPLQGPPRDAGLPSRHSNRPVRPPPPQGPPQDEGFPAHRGHPVRPPPTQGLPSHHNEGFPAHNGRWLAYEHDMGGYERPRDYSEGGPGVKRPFSAMADDRGYYEAGSHGYPRPRTDHGIAPPPQSHFADRIPYGRSAAERKPMPPLSTRPVPQSAAGTFDQFGGPDGGASSYYSSENHAYGTASGATEYKASSREPMGASYGGNMSSGYNYPGAPPAPYF